MKRILAVLELEQYKTKYQDLITSLTNLKLYVDGFFEKLVAKAAGGKPKSRRHPRTRRVKKTKIRQITKIIHPRKKSRRVI